MRDPIGTEQGSLFWDEPQPCKEKGMYNVEQTNNVRQVDSGEQAGELRRKPQPKFASRFPLPTERIGAAKQVHAQAFVLQSPPRGGYRPDAKADLGQGQIRQRYVAVSHRSRLRRGVAVEEMTSKGSNIM